jgi:hypothetical protein
MGTLSPRRVQSISFLSIFTIDSKIQDFYILQLLMELFFSYNNIYKRSVKPTGL